MRSCPKANLQPFLSIRCGIAGKRALLPSPPHVSASVCVEHRTSLSPLSHPPSWGLGEYSFSPVQVLSSQEERRLLEPNGHYT